MNRHLFGRIAAQASIALLSLTGYSQLSESSEMFSKSKVLESAKMLSAAEDADKINLMKIRTENEKAYKDFVKFYPDATDIHMHRDEQAIKVKCRVDGDLYRIGYSKKGKWIHTIKYYSPEKLAPEVLNQVVSSYPAYTPKSVTEVNVGNKTAYLVNIENKTSWKRIRVVSGDMDEYESFKKP